MSCDRQIKALEDCVRKHPRDREIVCGRIEMQAAWCIIGLICPQEVEDVECCAGRFKNGYMLKSIPKKCQDTMDRLDACIEQHQAQQEPG